MRGKNYERDELESACKEKLGFERFEVCEVPSRNYRHPRVCDFVIFLVVVIL